MNWVKYPGSDTGPAMSNFIPARRAAAMAACVPFSGVNRPNQTRRSPPGPCGHRATSTPLDTTAMSLITCRQESAVCRLTAAKRVPSPPVASIADSSQGVGGVCTLVSIGVFSSGAMATGR